MNRNQILLLAAAGGVAYLLYTNRAGVVSAAEDAEDTVTATLSGWKAVQHGPVWVPVINATEVANSLPTDLLARIAYQESHFRPEIINGSKASSAGALGIMQLMPQYFATVQRPTPFTTQDTVDQISEAGQLLAQLYRQFQNWTLAVAAYNWGAGNVNKFVAGNATPPSETVNYVSQILGDVPVASNQLLA